MHAWPGCALLLTVAVATGAHAQSAATAATAPPAMPVTTLPLGAAQPTDASIDTVRSSARFEVRPRMLRTLQGEFLRFGGAIERDVDDRRRVQVVLDAASAQFPGHPHYTEWALGENFFDAGRQRWITFRSAPFADELLHSGGDLHGTLEIRGQTRRVGFRLLAADCPWPGHGCPVRVRGQVSRGEFGMTGWRIAIRDRVEFSFDVWLRDAAAVPAPTDVMPPDAMPPDEPPRRRTR